MHTPEPAESNPRLIADLVGEGARIVSVTCMTRTLEDVYATAVAGELGPSALPLASDGRFEPSPSVARGHVPSVTPPGAMSALWVIARRAALESFNDRLTRLMNLVFALVVPIGLVSLVIRPLLRVDSSLMPGQLTFYLLVIGMMPAVGAVGIAAGQFAGERERGVLTPLLAAPASNLAIFGGKVLGSILLPLSYSVIALLVYLLSIAVVLGPAALGTLPIDLSITMVLLLATVTCLAAILGTLVSSRVRTYNAAQQVAGILLIPVWAAMFAVAFRLDQWGSAGLIAAVGGTLLLDVVLLSIAARTWRREEVLSQRS